MIYTFKLRKLYLLLLSMLILSIPFIFHYKNNFISVNSNNDKNYIKWVDFNVTYPALEKTLNLDINSKQKYNWIEILSCLAVKYGGDFKKYKEKDVDDLIKKIDDGQNISALTNQKYYSYYFEAYSAVLNEFIGQYKIKTETGDWKEYYGLKVFSPIAKGYAYYDFDDFGTQRSYGYKRKHLGHDLMALTGTPVIAVESGIVEELGWNKYGGWRIGIRSFDKKRYYYYAHLRKNYPYVKTLKKGNKVIAGDVIGYVGRTGYSSNENVNNIEQSHLHLGLQLIFDESQKDGTNQIWINLWNITQLLEKNRSAVERIADSKEFKRSIDFEDIPNFVQDE